MGMFEQIRETAKKAPKRIVLPEGDEKRTVIAAAAAYREGVAYPVLLGDSDSILKTASDTETDLAGIEIIDPSESAEKTRYAETLYELRKAKGLSREDTGKLILDPMYYGIMALKCGDADGFVSGAVHSTGDMLRPALQVIKTKPGTSIVSSSFLMDCPNRTLGENGVLVYADCVVNPCPTAEELAMIALSSMETAQKLLGFREPRIAFLSFSTKGSAKHALVDKVRSAVEIAHSLAPDVILDGELQLDAALVPEIAAQKAKGSPVAGRANILIFPDLQAGNIGYKMTERIARAQCFAVLQGLAKPCNDLSRGCSVSDIVNTIAATCAQTQ